MSEQRKTFGLSLVLSGLAVWTPHAAHAQTDEALRAEDMVLEDIVVTAQRREQRLQDVPLTVNALSAESIEAAGLTSTADLTAAMPGLNMASSVNAISPFIRGVGNTNTSPGDEAATALYVDGVYVSTLTAAVFALNNVERIEVLRGPQGTLFGRNATAGVIQIITRAPSHDPSSEVTLGYGNYDTSEGNAYLTGGLSPTLAADLAVRFTDQGEGWGTNLVTGNDVYRGRELAARSRWDWTPTDVTEVSFAVDYAETEPATLQAYSQVPGSVSFNGQTSAGLYNVQLERDVSAETSQWGANTQVRHDLDWARFVSITSYRDVSSKFQFDQDGTPVPRGYFTFDRGAETWTQEFQLLSQGGGGLGWILGAFYFHDDAYSLPSHLEGLLFAGGNLQINRFAEQAARSAAVFGEVTAELLPRTEVTAGLRFTRDERSINGYDSNVLFGVQQPVSNALSREVEFEEPTWRIAVNHEISDEVRAYVSYNRGFKSGVFNVANYTQPAVRPAFVDAYEIGLKSELFDRRLRVNGVAFYNDYTDIQFQISVPGGQQLLNAAAGTIYGVELEVDAAICSNLSLRVAVSLQESEYDSFANAQFFTPLPSGGYLESVAPADGNEMIFTPPVTANVTISYGIPSPVGEFELTSSLAYNGGFYFDAQNRIEQPEHTLLSAGVRWTSPDDAWGLRLWGRNLLDEEYYAVVQPATHGDTIVPAAPMTYGLTATRRF